jgi:hypothetical protein
MDLERVMLTLYRAPHTCALASHITLEEAGAAFEARRIDFGATEQIKPGYLACPERPRAGAGCGATRRSDHRKVIVLFSFSRQPRDRASRTCPAARAGCNKVNAYSAGHEGVPIARASNAAC